MDEKVLEIIATALWDYLNIDSWEAAEVVRDALSEANLLKEVRCNGQ